MEKKRDVQSEWYHSAASPAVVIFRALRLLIPLYPIFFIMVVITYHPLNYALFGHPVSKAAGLSLIGAFFGEAASIRASILKPGHLWPWQARVGTRPLGAGKYLVVVATDLMFGAVAGVIVYGEHVGLNAGTWKGALTLIFAGMSGPEVLHRLGGAIRK